MAVCCACNPHCDARITTTWLAAVGLNRIGLAALLKLLFSQWFEFETVQLGEDDTNVSMGVDFPSIDFLNDQCLDGFFDLLAVAQVKHGFGHPLSFRLFRADPARAGIPVVSKGVEVAFRSRWGGIERAVAVKLDARDQEVQFDIAHVLVADPEDIGLIYRQPGKGSFLKITHDRRLLIIGGGIIGVESNHTRCVAPFPRTAVDQVAGQVGITGKQIWQHIPPDSLIGNTLAIFGVGRDFRRQQVFHRRSPRAIPMIKEAHHHRE